MSATHSLDSRVPGDFGTCADRHPRIYWSPDDYPTTGPCPMCRQRGRHKNDLDDALNQGTGVYKP